MPRGRGHGRRQGQRRRVRRFLRPCLLVMLHRNPTHGYDLLDGLDAFGFPPGQQDPSLVYRALREMEAEGLVTSVWDAESRGPQRRVYQISPTGEAYLQEWITDLRQIRQDIDTLLAAYATFDQEGES